jgi:hypothetical protein
MRALRFHISGARFHSFPRRFHAHERKRSLVSFSFLSRFLPMPFVSRFLPYTRETRNETQTLSLFLPRSRSIPAQLDFMERGLRIIQPAGIATFCRMPSRPGGAG